MIDFKRYHGVGLACSGLLAALLFWNVALLGALGSDAGPLHIAERQFSWRSMNDMTERIAGVEVATGATKRWALAGPQSVKVVLGQSTVFRGIDTDVLNESQSDQRMPSRWVLFNGFGMSFNKVAYFTQPLLVSRARMETIIIGVHPAMAVGERMDAFYEPNAAITEIDLLGNKTSASDYATWNWIGHHGDRVNFLMRRQLHDWRVSVQRGFSNGALALAKPDAKPWRVPKRAPLPDRAAAENLEKQMAVWRMYGWFDPASYAVERNQNDALRSLVTDLKARFGADLRIVLLVMPESPPLREQLPPVARENLNSMLVKLRDKHSIVILDMNDAMPAEAFSDHAHLNPTAREAFTRELQRRLSRMGIK